MEAITMTQTSGKISQDVAGPIREAEVDREASQAYIAASQGTPAETQAERRILAGPRRPQGYRPDDASGVRQIYRGPEYEGSAADYAAAEPFRSPAVGQVRPLSSDPASPLFQESRPIVGEAVSRSFAGANSDEAKIATVGQRRTDLPPTPVARPAEPNKSATLDKPGSWFGGVGDARQNFGREDMGSPASGKPDPRLPVSNSAIPPRPVSPFSQALIPSDSTRGRRAQDDFDYQQTQAAPDSTQSVGTEAAGSSTRTSDPAGPAWLYAPAVPQRQVPSVVPVIPAQSSVADTLQHSRERVAARWFALKGVFAQPGQEPEVAPVRQKETRTPVLAVFSLAGGVGKTSLVATVGRALSSMGEKVLLTDTTSHGLLPFYFGASELRQGTVRTFSPPSGSTDAPIYLVSYDVDQKGTDEVAQEELTEEIINNSRGTHRILLDLNVNSSWIVRHMSRLNPTILVPVAPDMNSVISLQTLEKFFSGVNDGDGRPLQPYYVLNQFDTSLPLHLDVREVMRRQLGDRLLPFVIRRAPAVSEALAEGMTVVDYAPDAPVAEDYLNLATWLRTVAAPAAAGFRNVRWSER
jgi:cellulose synthase operon protein YhjQ